MPPTDRADDSTTEKAKMLRGELYWSFFPELVRERAACAQACRRFNTQPEDISRREQIELIIQ
jgi:hypothetical protein